MLTPEERVIDAEYTDAEVTDGEYTETDEGARKRNDLVAALLLLSPAFATLVATIIWTIWAWFAGQDRWVLGMIFGTAVLSLWVALSLFVPCAPNTAPAGGQIARMREWADARRSRATRSAAQVAVHGATLLLGLLVILLAPLAVFSVVTLIR